MSKFVKNVIHIGVPFLLIFFNGCKKIEEFRQDPDLLPLQQGFKISAAVGYCASLAAGVFEEKQIPSNVIFETGTNSQYSSSGLVLVNIDKNNPLPFNDFEGQILIGGIWDNVKGGGVISIVFGKLDLLTQDFKFYGVHTVPVVRKSNSDKWITVFAEQDIVIGEGSDTILHLGLSRIEFDAELDRLEANQPNDVFVAVKQNVWYINFDQRGTFSNVYDDAYIVNGGGQILEASNTAGGILYHALINTDYTFQSCQFNPSGGTAFIQNIKAGEGIDLGNIVLDFHGACDGQAKVKFAIGKYLSANGREIDLNFD